MPNLKPNMKLILKFKFVNKSEKTSKPNLIPNGGNLLPKFEAKFHNKCCKI